MANASIALMCGLNFHVGCQYVRIQMLMKHKPNGKAKMRRCLLTKKYNKWDSKIE